MTQRILLAIGLLTAVWGCSDDPVRQGDALLDIRVGDPTMAAEGRMQFRLVESWDHPETAGPPQVYLDLVTETIYPCSNYRVCFDLVLTESRLEVVIRGVEVPEVCLTSLGPALARQRLPIPEGIYEITIRHGDAADTYALNVTGVALSVAGQATERTAPLHPLCWRYPENSFAYLCGTLVEDAWICDDFLARLTAEVDLTEFTFPDHGVIPYPTRSSGYWNDTPARYYTVATPEDFDRAGEVLETYSREVLATREGVGLSLWSWDNRRHLSWLTAAPR
jgi:hypothetical protein